MVSPISLYNMTHIGSKPSFVQPTTLGRKNGTEILCRARTVEKVTTGEKADR
jgi:hypothetical protein